MTTTSPPAATPESPVHSPMTTLSGLVKAARPRQWIKNVLVLAAPLASAGLMQIAVLEKVGLAFVTFCMAASAVYLINDAIDVAEDRVHPVKRNRPIAAGLARSTVRTRFAISVWSIGILTGLSCSVSSEINTSAMASC